MAVFTGRSTDRSGIHRSRSLWDATLDLPADTLGCGAAHVHRLPGPQDAPLLVLERSVTLPSRLGGDTARIAVAMDAAEIDSARRAFMADLAPYLALLGLVLTGAGWAQLWVGLRPLASLGARIAALRAGRAERMGEHWPVELRPVAEEIDGLLTARETETARAHARAADLAHGLKTPLQALMGEAARLRAAGADGQAAGIEETARAMRRTVDRELARARTATRVDTVYCDAAEVAAGLISVLRRTPDGAQLDWSQEIPAGHHVALDAADLSEALGALTENAARHAASRVVLRARSQGALLLIDIIDDGPGIPAPQRRAVIARHGRADISGSGLGLSIAAEMAHAAGGWLDLGDAAPGLAATLALPRVLRRGV